MSENNLNQLSNLSRRVEEAIKQELQKALTEGSTNSTPLVNNLEQLPEQLSQSLAPIFNLIGSVAGSRIITTAQKQQVIKQINAIARNDQQSNA